MSAISRALRAAFGRPAYAATMILSVAVGISANAAVFAVIDAAILNPLPFPSPDRVVGIGAAYPRLNRQLEFFESLSGPEYAAIRAGTPSFLSVTGFDLGNESVMIRNAPERAFTAYFWDDPFRVLQVQPSTGRTFTDEELRQAAPVAILSDRFARAHFEGDRAVGRTLTIGGRLHTVIGTVPARVLLYGTDLWLPMATAAETLPQNRRQFNALARLRDGSDVRIADAELAAVAASIEREHSRAMPEYDAFVLQARPWSQIHVWGFRHVATLAFLSVGLLLVLLAANLANLTLARASERTIELAVRAALGADRRSLIGLIASEVTILTALGGLLGAFLAWAGTQGLMAIAGDFLPDGTTLALNFRVIALALTLSFATALTVAIVPAIQIWRRDHAPLLSVSTVRSTGTRHSRRIQRGVVGLQIAIATVVVGAAAVLGLNVVRTLAVDPGFPDEGVLAMRLTLPLPKYDGGRAMQFFDALTERVRLLPSVQSATVSNQPPPGVFSRAVFDIQGRPPASAVPSAFYTTAGSAYQQTLGFQLVRGRWFDERADRDGAREVVINESAAARFFPDQDPVGQVLLVAPPHSDRRPTAIVGVVRDVRNRGLLPSPAPEIIASVRQIPDRRQSQLYLVVRGRSGIEGLLSEIRPIVSSLDPEQPVYAISTLRSDFEAGVAQRRTAAILLGIFAMLAAGLAMLGVHGVVFRGVTARTREIGIRSALGATRASVRRLVVADAMKPVLAGTLTGGSFLVLGTRVVATWIFGVTPELPAVVAAMAVVSVAGAVATLLPVLRAGSIAPLDALRDT